MNKAQEQFIEHIAYNLRVSSLLATTTAESGHPTSCLSAAEIVATLFFYAMHFDPHNPSNPNNDRFILSKGHASPLLYAVWKELGVLTEQDLLTLRTFDSPLEGHPTPRFSRSEAATGSLGQGLSVGIGMALQARLDAHNFYVYVLMGDMETTEGSVWEAAELASYYQLNNLIALVDCNTLGQSEFTLHKDHLQPYEKKFSAFGWHTISVDGHSVDELAHALDQAKKIHNKPTVILAKTIKGKGLEQIENQLGFHGKALNNDELHTALTHLKIHYKDASQKPSYDWHPTLPPVAKSTINTLFLDNPCPYKKETLIATRKAYGQALTSLGKKNTAIVALDAEVKNSTYAELFEHAYPDRFFQAFIAEQNMVGMATGLALRGKIPFASTFGAFFTRAYDQIRMAAIGLVSLRLVGSHAGVSIGEDGPSQMALEDIALMRCLPNSIVLYPCDGVSTYALLSLMLNKNDGISYLRTTRQETPIIYEVDEQFIVGGCNILRQSKNDKACVIAAGITVHEALKAYDLLAQENVFITVIDAYSIKPLAAQTIIESAQRARNRIITVEDHYLQGGLGQAISYELRNTDINITCLAVTKLPRSGAPKELMSYEGIDAHSIIKKVTLMDF